MPGSLTRGGGEDVPGACPTRNFTYLARVPWKRCCPFCSVNIIATADLATYSVVSSNHSKQQGTGSELYISGTTLPIWSPLRINIHVSFAVDISKHRFVFHQFMGIRFFSVWTNLHELTHSLLSFTATFIARNANRRRLLNIILSKPIDIEWWRLAMDWMFLLVDGSCENQCL